LVALVWCFVGWLEVGAERPASDAQVSLHDGVRHDSGQLMFVATGESEGKQQDLSEDGDRALQLRMSEILSEGLRNPQLDYLKLLAEVREVWVAPTRAAMATAMIVLERGWDAASQSGVMGNSRTLPDVRIHKSLRSPLVKAPQDQVTFMHKDDSALYKALDDVCKRYKGNGLDESDIMPGLRDAFVEAYIEAKEEDEQEWLTVATKASEVHESIRTLKAAIVEAGRSRVLLIGDAFVATHLFVAHLPTVQRENPDGVELGSAPEDTMKVMQRAVQGVAPTGAVACLWEKLDSSTTDRQIRDPRTRADLPLLKNVYYVGDAASTRCLDEAMLVPIDAQQVMEVEMQAKFALPKKVQWVTYGANKKKKIKHNPTPWGYKKYKPRLISLSWVKRGVYGEAARGYLSWLTPLGDEVKGYVSLIDLQFELLKDNTIRVTRTVSGEKWIIDTGKAADNISFHTKLTEALGAISR